MNNYQIYFHKRNDTNEIFYVGMGKDYRPKDKHSRSQWWWNVVNKVGYTIEIVHEGLTWDEACEYETKYIKDFGRKDMGTGILVNMTDGGDGTHGHIPWNKGITGVFKHTEEHKKHISNVMKGKVLSTETRNKLSIAHTGKKVSLETREKQSKIHKGKKLSKQACINISKGKLGEKHPHTRLTKEDVLKIRELYSTGNYTQKKLGEIYNYSHQGISKIIKRKTWSHLTI